MKKWNLIEKAKLDSSEDKKHKLIEILLTNRGITTKAKRDEFLFPSLSQIKLSNLEIDLADLKKTILRINKAIKNGEDIIVFGDYDVDGICGSAILWETLNQMGAKVMPYIPSRFEEGYGLSQKGIDVVLEKNPNVKLIITVDNGIVASDAVLYAT
jgi:single-stranded-DNA-specific exonuclease